MLTSVLKFLKGYVVVHLSGYSPERFLNLCCHHKIVLWGLRSTGTEYEMCMSIAAFQEGAAAGQKDTDQSCLWRGMDFRFYCGSTGGENCLQPVLFSVLSFCM